MNFLGNI